MTDGLRGHALVLGDGDPPRRDDLDAAWPGWDDDASIVVAADGGARLAAALGLEVAEWAGDGDSLSGDELEALRSKGVAIQLAAVAKDESDLELAVLRALRHGVARISVLGALRGPRLDHELANVFLLAHPAFSGGASVQIVDPRARVSLLAAPDARGERASRVLTGRVGDVVSLFPLDAEVAGIETTGLRYPLRDEPLVLGPARGLSNVRTTEAATVSATSGRLLIVETPANLGG